MTLHRNIVSICQATQMSLCILTYLAAQLVGSRSSTCDYALGDTDDTLFLNMWKHEEL